MKGLLSILVAITAVMILGTASAYSPLEISGDGVVVKSYDLDLEVNSVILEVQVNDSGSLELTFEREFFDSTNLGEDDEFFAIIDGNKLPYIETETTSKSRTIETSLSSGVYEIEIFGSHLLGKTIDEHNLVSQIQENNAKLLNEKESLSKQINNLSSDLANVKVENNILESENKELEKKVFEPSNLISETEGQVTNLISETEGQVTNLISETEGQTKNINSVFEEQITALMAWFKSFF
jgi:hypothetical protein